MDKAPIFYPDVPEPLLKGATAQDKWMYEQMSVARQQNEWIIKRLADGDERFDKIEADAKVTAARLEVIEKLKTKLFAKWSVVAFLLMGILGPVVMMVLTVTLTRWLEKHWK